MENEENLTATRFANAMTWLENVETKSEIARMVQEEAGDLQIWAKAFRKCKYSLEEIVAFWRVQENRNRETIINSAVNIVKNERQRGEIKALKLKIDYLEKSINEDQKRLEANRKGADTSNKPKKDHAKNAQAEMQKLAEEVWAEPGKADYRNSRVARIICSKLISVKRNGERYDEGYIAEIIKKPKK